MYAFHNDKAQAYSKNTTFYRATACNATHGIAVAILSVSYTHLTLPTNREV